MKVLISVIVPVYKIEEYLSKCIDSVLRQTYPCLEIILVDDGSPDGCPRICDEYAQKDNRIKVIHKQNGGLSDARNAGIDLASGEYLMFVDGDDAIHPDMVKILYDSAIKYDAQLAIGGIVLVNEKHQVLPSKEKIVETKCLSPMEFWAYHYNGNSMHGTVAWNKLYHKSLLENLRYMQHKQHEDVFMLQEIIQRCKKIVLCKEDVYYYLQRSGSIMGQTFSIKNLDAVEAFAQRATYFIAQKNQRLSILAYQHGFNILVKGYLCLDMCNVQNKMRCTELRKQYKTLFYHSLIRNMPKSKKILHAVFFASPKAYVLLHDKMIVRLHREMKKLKLNVR